MTDLTREQHETMNEGEGPPRLRDPVTGETYVLVKADLYEHMRKILDGFARSAGWDDPALDVYEKYRDRP